ncbi:MAG: hypothetical protein IJB70_08205 [Clostridia bacterium]|nr:hypothetical protein [Clostridia bacterium]
MKYTGKKLNEIIFPLGGIGTGSIGIAGNGKLVDWEIFNRPSKGSINGYSHFAVRAIDGDKIIPAVLRGDETKDLMGQHGLPPFSGYGFGPVNSTMAGFPHFENSSFEGEFPIAKLNFSDSHFPGEIKMTVFNPFIPNDSYNSSLPGAFFEFEINNTSDKDLKYQVAFTVANPYECSVNKSENSNIITLYNAGAEKDSTEYGDLTMITDAKDSFAQSYWYRGKWLNDIVTYWNEFSGEKEFLNREYDTPGQKDIATLIADVNIKAGESKKVRFVLSWNSPNNYNYWSSSKDENVRKPWKNYYATVFESSKESAKYCIENYDSLFERTLKFKDALFGSSLPESVIDAAASNLSVLKSPTVLRLEDGSFYGWEGVNEKMGSCEGTCQHVWNYAYAMCYLFPDLERSIRDNEFKFSTADDGKMAFRMTLPVGSPMAEFRACLDGQMGSVIKCYREWKMSGDSEWLKSNWQNIKKVLEYAWSDKNPDRWDLDKDGILEGRQHHTLDKELFGPSSWLEGFYLAALKCASEMADYLGDDEKKNEYIDIYEKGKQWTKDNLFNGSHFVQKVDVCDKSIVDSFDAAEEYWNEETKQIKYQIAEGSIIDQVLAQWHADILGIGDIYDPGQLDIALESMMKNNYKASMRYFANPWRLFSVNDEAGTVICDYPEGCEKPKIPIPYCEETMTGFEYSFAGLLCSRGKYEDGFKVVKAIRDRFDGEKRNPWNEFECGSNYARSMASYSLVPILSGFEFDMPNGHISFKPYKDGEFSCIWSVAGSWGDINVNNSDIRINVFEKPITLKSLGLKFAKNVTKVKIDGKDIDFEFKNGVVYFKETKICQSMEIG